MFKLNPAYVAASALVAIQVGVGLIYKLSQRDGVYTFSAPSSIAISELIKFALSTSFFYHECTRRDARSRARYYSPLPNSERTFMHEKRGRQQNPSEGSSSEQWTPRANHAHGSAISAHLSVPTFTEFCRTEVPAECAFGFAQLALLYALINNTAFALYKIADPGTISLIKSSITLVTALLTRFTLGTKIAKLQWIAILIQVCGITVTQYRPGSGSSYPLYTYLLLFFLVFLSAISGVYNQNLYKSHGVSLHAANMILYGSGAGINLMLHGFIRTLKADEPSLFSGYGSLEAKMLILSNVFVGLTITAVYKYADAVIKCFATAVSTGVLLYTSPIFFNVDFSFMLVPGTVLVFVATWLYMEAAPLKKDKAKQDCGIPPSKPSAQSFLTKRYPWAIFTIGIIVTAVIVSTLTLSDTRMPDVKQMKSHQDINNIEKSVQVLQSPFKNSLAYVRWASERPERMPLLRKYAPFFHELHFSMPGYAKDKPKDFVNLTHDSYESPDVLFYKPLAETMQLLLEAPAGNPEAEIDGILNFHFDAWIDPINFAGENLNLIWYATSSEPRLECMNSLARYPDYWGWGPEHRFHDQGQKAVKALANLDLGYNVDVDEWCVGWSDIYFIPRRFFADFIYLSNIFAAYQVFHEVAVPTMIHIIDRTRRAHPSRSVVNHIGDCYGSCCSAGAHVHDVLDKRCGHRLDYMNATVVDTTYERLDREAAMLGSKVEGAQWAMQTSYERVGGVDSLDKGKLNTLKGKLRELQARGDTKKDERLNAIQPT